MQVEKIKNMPSVSSLLKISLGLVIISIILFAFVYADTASVTVDGTNYDVEYMGDGVLITAMDADVEFPTLLISVDVSSNPGILEIELERSFFDSQFQGEDDVFFVLVDGLDIEFNEEKTSTSRILTFELPSGTEDVEIIGTVFANSLAESPEPETPTIEEPTIEEPTIEEPTIEEPTIEEPTIEEPTIEEPKVEEPTTVPKETKPKTECGPGTILKEGVCVLDERCGPGTIMEDGVCVLKPSPPAETTSLKGMGMELVITIIAAFIITGAIGIILGLMSKAGKSRD